jgi:hypothetical protein
MKHSKLKSIRSQKSTTLKAKRSQRSTTSRQKVADMKAALPRARGRPIANSSEIIDRDVILSCGLQLARTIPLAKISVVRVARELKITPRLIHYYLGRGEFGGRDGMTAGIMSIYYREQLNGWPKSTGNWRVDLENVARYLFQCLTTYPGIAAYIAAHEKFRLIQPTREAEAHYGRLAYEKYLGTFRNAGFEPDHAVIYGHVVNEFVTACAVAAVSRPWPGEHRTYLAASLADIDPVEYPNLHGCRLSLYQLDARVAFNDGLELFLSGIANARADAQAPSSGGV